MTRIPRYLLLVVGLAAPLQTQEGDWRATIESRIGQVEKTRSATFALAVRELGSDPLLARHAERPMVLASNTKLFTAAAALLALGPDYRWTTDLYYDNGLLTVVGGGDPSLRSMEDTSMPDRLLEALVLALPEDRGDAITVQLDPSLFDKEVFHPLWPPDQTPNTYTPAISALPLEGGCLAVSVTPQNGSSRPEIESTVPLKTTYRPGKAKRCVASLRPDWTASVAGPVRSSQVFTLAVPDPFTYFGLWLEHGLARAKVQLTGRPTLLSAPYEPSVPPLLEFRSRWDLAELLAFMNKESDNFSAEHLLKTLGAEATGQGSWVSGIAAIRAELLEAGLDLSSVRLVDGSGMAREAGGGNRASAALVVDLLDFMAHQEPRISQPFFDSLPIGGLDGSLKARFTEERFAGRVRAKTGFINGASTLSGYLHRPDGGILAFSMLCNYDRDGTDRTHNRHFKALQEEILGILLDADLNAR